MPRERSFVLKWRDALTGRDRDRPPDWLTRTEQHVALVWSQFARADGYCAPGVREVARMSMRSKTTVVRTLDKLERLRWIVPAGRLKGYGTKAYRLTIPADDHVPL